MRILALFAVFILTAISCDIVEPPFMNEVDVSDPGDTVVVKRVLIEEFTGHLCPNCPEGKEVANSLKSFYGDRIVVMSIHSGIFARPLNDDDFYNDYRTGEGDEIASTFGVTQYPSGMVSRTGYDNNLVLSPSAWGSAAAQLIEADPDFQIIIDISYHLPSHTLDIEVTTNALSSLEGSYSLSLFLLEDGIISPQKTNDDNYEDGIIYDYEHNNVLRAAINDTWGEPLSEEGVLPNESFFKSYFKALDENWNYQNCKVLAIVYNAETNEVLQAEVKPISR